jgi:hypothetical protein
VWWHGGAALLAPAVWAASHEAAHQSIAIGNVPNATTSTSVVAARAILITKTILTETPYLVVGVHRAGLFAGPLSRYTSWQLEHASAMLLVASETFS